MTPEQHRDRLIADLQARFNIHQPLWEWLRATLLVELQEQARDVRRDLIDVALRLIEEHGGDAAKYALKRLRKLNEENTGARAPENNPQTEITDGKEGRTTVEESDL